MKNQHLINFLLFCSLAFVAGIFLTPISAQAYPSRFDSRCASCHDNDSQTCDGCHQHHGNVSAFADQAAYDPGSLVTVTLNGGTRGGWVRGKLYDQNGTVVDQVGGPEGMGDDGAGNPVTFPVTLQATAPGSPGQYTWEAAWFGAPSSGGGTHIEDGVNVTINVTASSAVPEEAPPVSTWDRIKACFR